MLNLEKIEVLNLYLFLSGISNLSDNMNDLLIKLEKEIYSTYSVKEMENFKNIFNDKGRI